MASEVRKRVRNVCHIWEVRRRVTTRRGHQGGHLTWCMSAPAAPANAPDRVHPGDRQRHVQAALGSNTSREARKQAPGQIAHEK
jgi:hypothetical protein